MWLVVVGWIVVGLALGTEVGREAGWSAFCCGPLSLSGSFAKSPCVGLEACPNVVGLPSRLGNTMSMVAVYPAVSEG